MIDLQLIIYNSLEEEFKNEPEFKFFIDSSYKKTPSHSSSSRSYINYIYCQYNNSIIYHIDNNDKYIIIYISSAVNKMGRFNNISKKIELADPECFDQLFSSIRNYKTVLNKIINKFEHNPKYEFILSPGRNIIRPVYCKYIDDHICDMYISSWSINITSCMLKFHDCHSYDTSSNGCFDELYKNIKEHTNFFYEYYGP